MLVAEQPFGIGLLDHLSKEVSCGIVFNQGIFSRNLLVEVPIPCPCPSITKSSMPTTVAIDLVALAGDIVSLMPRGNGHLADQLRRAATSVPLNIAEGSGEYAANDKARFYRIARRSATECAALLDVCRKLELVPIDQLDIGRELLLRLVAMLIKMAKRCEQRSGTGSSSNTGAGS